MDSLCIDLDQKFANFFLMGCLVIILFLWAIQSCHSYSALHGQPVRLCSSNTLFAKTGDWIGEI
jgi:hypothetical protein